MFFPALCSVSILQIPETALHLSSKQLLLFSLSVAWHRWLKSPPKNLQKTKRKPSLSFFLPCKPHTHTHVCCLYSISWTFSKHTHTGPDPQGVICLLTPCLKSKWPGGAYLFVPFLPFFIRTWLYLNNSCLLVNFASVLTLDHIPPHSLRRRRGRLGCLVICYAVKHLMDVHLVFESSSRSWGAFLLCTSSLQRCFIASNYESYLEATSALCVFFS